MKPSLGSVFAREGLKAPRCLRRTGLGFVQNSTALVLSCSVWSLIKSGAKMKAKGKCLAKRTPQTGFLPLAAGSLGTAVTSSATALRGTSALPPSLPRASLALLYPSHPTVPRDEVHRSRFQTAFSELPPAALQRHCMWAHGDKDTQHITGRCCLCAPGAHNIYFPWNLA